jgi:mono/diheme cytochrome c family protein
LTTDQIRLVANWINQGARNTSGCAPDCDSSNITYSGKVRSILQTHCLGCHTGSTATGGFIALDTYQAVKDQVDFGALQGVIEHAPGFSAMPKNSAKLSDCKITIIRKWIEAGAPNN